MCLDHILLKCNSHFFNAKRLLNAKQNNTYEKYVLVCKYIIRLFILVFFFFFKSAPGGTGHVERAEDVPAGATEVVGKAGTGCVAFHGAANPCHEAESGKGTVMGRLYNSIQCMYRCYFPILLAIQTISL